MERSVFGWLATGFTRKILGRVLDRRGTTMRALLVLCLLCNSASAMDRCFVQSAPDGKSTCDLTTNIVTYTCDGQDMNRTPNCLMSSGEPAVCELRHTRLREPPDIWCDTPNIILSADPRVTLLAQGERTKLTPTRRVAADSASSSKTISKAVCKFEYYALGDSKGKDLAANAKAECLANEKLKQDGRGAEASLEAYNFWKDNRLLNKRTVPAQPKSSTCTPNGFGSMNCREN